MCVGGIWTLGTSNGWEPLDVDVDFLTMQIWSG